MNGWSTLGALGIALCVGTGWARSAQPIAASPPPPASLASPIDPSGDWAVRWDRGFAGWWPTIFNGRLSIKRHGDLWFAGLHFDESGVKPVFKSMHMEGDRIQLVFTSPANGHGSEQEELEMSLWVHDCARLVGEMRWGDAIAWTPIGAEQAERLRGHSLR